MLFLSFHLLVEKSLSSDHLPEHDLFTVIGLRCKLLKNSNIAASSFQCILYS